MKRIRQFLPLFLILAFLPTMLPTAGFAVEAEPAEDTLIEEYTIVLAEETVTEMQADKLEEEMIANEQMRRKPSTV